MADTNAVNTAAVDEESFEKEVEKEVEKLSTGNRRYLRPREIIAFLLTTFGQKNLAQFVDANRQFFMISFLGITGKAYGIIVGLESIYDALDDSLSGLIIDRTRTRWGRLRPYMIVTVPIWGIAALMLFTAPNFGVGSAGTIIWAVVAIFLYNLGMSYFGAWNILLYNITPNIKERDNLIATSKFFELFGMWLPSLLPFVLEPLKKTVGMQNVYTGFSVAMVGVAAATAIYGFFAMRERVPLASREQMQEIGIIESFKNAIKNKPMLISVIANFFGSFKSVGGATESFFWYHNTGKLMNGSIAGLFTGIPNYIITPLTPKLIRKFGARNTSIGAGVFGGIAYTLMFIIGYQPFGKEGMKWQGTNLALNLAYLTIMLTICGLPNCILRVCSAVLQGDVYDYSEWKYGVRNEALVQTITNYFGKLANAVTGLLSGLVITLVGYVAHKDALGNIVQETNPSVLNGFFAVFALLPAFARLFNGLTWIFFPVHGKKKEKMLLELEQRRAERVSEMESED
ncbi:MAG: hypothetical protein E7514_04345 [Ruminococcaceae bacterium]|nr:hypothetical protein [Oscillospiraceae bacterium]